MNKKINIFTVSELTSIVKNVLEEAFPSIWVQGEISNLKNYGNHLFFTLKDENAQIRAVLFRGYTNSLKFNPKDGMSVIVRGTLSLYQARGEFQLIANYIEPLGIGLLKLAYEELKEKLAKKGYFDEERKKKLPFLPQRIAIITSPKGAVIRDILNILKRRYYNLHIIIVPVKVQGEGAKEEIASAIKFVNDKFIDTIEVIILARGGGSLEDLWAFNEEIVADAIYHSKIPIISAIGHETDFTIADFVADMRASTPTQAGMLAVPDINEVLASLESAEKRLGQVVKGELRHLKLQLQTILASAIFRQPRRVLENNIQRLDEVVVNLEDVLEQKLKRAGQAIQQAQMAMVRIEPKRFLLASRNRLEQLAGRAGYAFHKRLSEKVLQITAAENRLQALNPRGVLERGYSITVNQRTGKVVTAAADVTPGDVIQTELARQNTIESVVQKTQSA